jgi:hypothetical protein
MNGHDLNHGDGPYEVEGKLKPVFIITFSLSTSIFHIFIFVWIHFH